MPKPLILTKLTRLLLLATGSAKRRSEQTITNELLLESGDAFLLESSPDESGNPEFIRLES